MTKSVFSEDHKKAISDGLKGKKFSEEHKQALKEAWKKRRAKMMKTTNTQTI